MTADAFIDTNILLYSVSADPAEAGKLEAVTLYSEDLSHGQDYDGVRVVNPFLWSSHLISKPILGASSV